MEKENEKKTNWKQIGIDIKINKLRTFVWIVKTIMLNALNSLTVIFYSPQSPFLTENETGCESKHWFSRVLQNQ